MGPRMPCGARAGAARMKGLGLRSRTGTWAKYMAMGKLGARRGSAFFRTDSANLAQIHFHCQADLGESSTGGLVQISQFSPSQSMASSGGPFDFEGSFKFKHGRH